MRIKPEEVTKVAQLARLSLTEAETLQMAREFDDILAHFAVIDGYDLSEATAFDPSQAAPVPLREDQPRLFEEQEKLHQNVKQRKDGLIVVPKILD